MSFFRALQSRIEGGAGSSESAMPDHPCIRCQIPMTYHGAHALRTGGLNRGWGVAADMFLGAGDETAINQFTEKNVIVHVMVCPQCGTIDWINDPRRGF